MNKLSNRKVGKPTNLILNNYRGNRKTDGGQAHFTKPNNNETRMGS
jgi:hypothetical protein